MYNQREQDLKKRNVIYGGHFFTYWVLEPIRKFEVMENSWTYVLSGTNNYVEMAWLFGSAYNICSVHVFTEVINVTEIKSDNKTYSREYNVYQPWGKQSSENAV